MSIFFSPLYPQCLAQCLVFNKSTWWKGTLSTVIITIICFATTRSAGHHAGPSRMSAVQNTSLPSSQTNNTKQQGRCLPWTQHLPCTKQNARCFSGCTTCSPHNKPIRYAFLTSPCQWRQGYSGRLSRVSCNRGNIWACITHFSPTPARCISLAPYHGQRIQG